MATKRIVGQSSKHLNKKKSTRKNEVASGTASNSSGNHQKEANRKISASIVRPRIEKSRREIVSEGGTVLYEGVRYRWSNGAWYYHESNTKVPTNLSIRLHFHFLPADQIPKVKKSSLELDEVRRPHFIIQGGLPGLGKKR